MMHSGTSLELFPQQWTTQYYSVRNFLKYSLEYRLSYLCVHVKGKMVYISIVANNWILRNRNLTRNDSHNLWSSVPRTDHIHAWGSHCLRTTQVATGAFSLSSYAPMNKDTPWAGQGWRNRRSWRIWLARIRFLTDLFIGHVSGIRWKSVDL
jgi:hypothetical protein